VFRTSSYSAGIRTAITASLLFLIISGANAQPQPNSDTQRSWEIYHRLLGDREFKPSDLCLDVINGAGTQARCANLLEKLRQDEFTFVAPLKRSNSPNIRSFEPILDQCSHHWGQEKDEYGVPLIATSGFAFYRKPSEISPRGDRTIYLFKSEDFFPINKTYNDNQLGKDGNFIVFFYPNCDILERLVLFKDNTQNSNLEYLSEPIVISGSLFIMNFYSVQDASQKFYVLRLNDVAGNGQNYSFETKTSGGQK